MAAGPDEENATASYEWLLGWNVDPDESRNVGAALRACSFELTRARKKMDAVPVAGVDVAKLVTDVQLPHAAGGRAVTQYGSVLDLTLWESGPGHPAQFRGHSLEPWNEARVRLELARWTDERAELIAEPGRGIPVVYLLVDARSPAKRLEPVWGALGAGAEARLLVAYEGGEEVFSPHYAAAAQLEILGKTVDALAGCETARRGLSAARMFGEPGTIPHFTRDFFLDGYGACACGGVDSIDRVLAMVGLEGVSLITSRRSHKPLKPRCFPLLLDDTPASPRRTEKHRDSKLLRALGPEIRDTP